MLLSYPIYQDPDQPFISSNQPNYLTDHLVIRANLSLPEPALDPLDDTDYLLLTHQKSPLSLILLRIFIHLLVIHIHLCLSARPQHLLELLHLIVAHIRTCFIFIGVAWELQLKVLVSQEVQEDVQDLLIVLGVQDEAQALLASGDQEVVKSVFQCQVH